MESGKPCAALLSKPYTVALLYLSRSCKENEGSRSSCGGGGAGMVGGGEQEGSGAEPHRAGKRQQCALPSSGALLLGSTVCPLTGVLRREAAKRKVSKAHFTSGFVIEDSREELGPIRPASNRTVPRWAGIRPTTVKSGKGSEGKCCPGLLGRQPYFPLALFLP